MRQQHVVVVGASLAGLRAVEALAAQGFDGHLTVVGKEPMMPYNRPPLSKEALSPEFDDRSLMFRVRAQPEHTSWLLGDPAISMDLQSSSVTVAEVGQIEFDKLLVATGLSPRTLPIPAPRAGRHVVRTIEDARSLRGQLGPGRRVLVVGAGVLGCELAASARRAGAEVIVVAPETIAMERVIGVELGEEVMRRHRSQGVDFRMGVVVLRYASAGARTRVLLSNDEEEVVDVVVEAIGSQPNVDWLEGNGLDLSDGVLCDAWMCAEPSRRVYAAGDLARFANPLFDDVPRRVEHWSMPADTSKRAVAGMLGDHRRDETAGFTPLPTFWSDQFDWRIQAFGMPSLGIDDVRVLDGEVGGADFVLGYHQHGRLLGLAGVGTGVNRHRSALRAALAEAVHA